MDVRWLQDFLTVAETSNFSRAAASRNISQAAFSRRIKSLESWLGVTLVDRSVFPTKLTPEGEIFREHAAGVIQQIAEARVELSGQAAPSRSEVRIALPHALATGRLPSWVSVWSKSCSVNFAITTGSVHDTVTALVSGEVDILIGFHNPQQPIHLSAGQYDRAIICSETLRPYATKKTMDMLLAPWPGTARHPVPVLMFSPGAYLARMVDLILSGSSTQFHSITVLRNDMADVLRETAAASMGVAWLPSCSAELDRGLIAIGGDKWSLPLSIIAYRDRSNKRAAANRLWNYLYSRKLA